MNKYLESLKEKITVNNETLDAPVNYFYKKLIEKGAKPLFSCGGHPDDFYILFTASLTIAQKISAMGFFTVELFTGNRWRLSLIANELQTKNFSFADRDRILTNAANSWENWK